MPQFLENLTKMTGTMVYVPKEGDAVRACIRRRVAKKAPQVTATVCKRQNDPPTSSCSGFESSFKMAET